MLPELCPEEGSQFSYWEQPQICLQNYVQRKAASFHIGDSHRFAYRIMSRGRQPVFILGAATNLLTDLYSSHLRLYRIEDDFF
jgi:hypothetical protein